VKVDEAVRTATVRISATGVPNAALDAELLLRHVMGWDRATLLAETKTEIGEQAAARYFALVDERASRRPLQHLTGIQAFWRHKFRVTPDVLIPRPETEILVETALGLLRQMPNPLMVEVGTGSGCIALSLAMELPNAEIHATEISLAALAVAEDNARRLGLADRVSFHLGDLLVPVADLAGRLDMVVSNPPYVDPADRVSLAPEVRDHEPALALFPGGDAYAVYRRLVPQAMRLLRPGGRLLLEIGQGMSQGVEPICRETGLTVETVIPDLQSIPRALVAYKPGRSR
jgi:release factor glutamine methyltransferase